MQVLLITNFLKNRPFAVDFGHKRAKLKEWTESIEAEGVDRELIKMSPGVMA